MGVIGVYGIVFGIVGLFFLFYFYYVYRRNQKIKAQIRAEYGKVPEWKLDERDYASMKKYYHQKQFEGAVLDDITWTDLNMDEIFKQVKNTQSSIGDEYSYYFFRRQKNPDLQHFEEAVQSMDEKAEARERLQFAFYRIGRKTNNQLIDLLVDPSKFPKISMLLIFLATIISIGSLIWLAINIDYGILAVCLSFCLGMILFSIVLRKIYQAFEALGMFTRMVRAAKLMVKLDLPVFKKETELMRKNLNVFKNITALADYIIQVSGSSNSLMMIITSYFSLYGYAYFAMVKLFRKYRSEALELYETIGYVELCVAIASYRNSLTYYCQPDFTDQNQIEFEEIIHPLLKEAVPNTHRMDNKILITGSNASGKSTFARTLAVNAVLGQLFNTCLAKRYSFKPCAIYSSMNLKDDIVTGDSFYMAEIKSLKRLLKIAESTEYAMIFMDEMFKGTNMIERIAAASIILQKFAALNCFICLATHDVELSRILGDRYENYHFREVITAEDILFDFTLREGVTTGSNAIKLLAYCHYDQEIVSQAEAYAEKYRASGEWKSL
ncbi:MutS-related protein [Enterococcus malodoratus]|uniref:MutS-related protein n=1 Tax=Enterococcus malodoratus TaxID=71451 RepID=UPI003FD5D4E5